MLLKNALKDKLTKEELDLVPKAFDQVGSIAIFSEFPEELSKKEKIIGNTLIEINKPIKTVVKKVSKHSGIFRTKKVKIIAGKRSKITEHKESGVRVRLNIDTCYFSPRLSSERLRIAKLVKKGESVLVLFSGVGIYPFIIAKHSNAKKIVGVELNNHAHKFAVENLKYNKVDNIEFINSDVRKYTPKTKFDRIIMPLPGDGEKFLGIIPKLAKKGAMIHFYDFQHDGEFDKSKIEIKNIFPNAKILRVVRTGMYAPRWFRLCVDFKI